MDITDAIGVWLSTEDKLFYKQQLDSNGNIGFCTNKITDIHPSKTILFRDTQPCGGDEYESSNDKFLEIGTSGEEFEAEEENNSIKKRQKTRLSCKKTEIICKSLSTDGVDLPTPSQSGIQKSLVKEGKRIKESMKTI